MADTVDWPGASGKKYSYYVHEITWTPNENQDGNYLFAKIENNVWVPVYFGEGDLQDRKADHLANGCVTRKGATHFHCHLNGNSFARGSEESDLLANYPKAYAPTGCNVKPGG